jgi:hypothetical protein
MTDKINITELEFLRESNRIEGITRPVSEQEILAFLRFMKLEAIGVDDLCRFVSACQPDAVLRDKVGLDVRIGDHMPIRGGVRVRELLGHLLKSIEEGNFDPYEAHVEYEMLHPFTDGNGRSGRMLWWWMMGGSRIGFLHQFYYQTLDHAR